jgi:hypothetical protein
VIRRPRWVPREHGAWAILAVPLLLGIAAAGAVPAHALLAVAAVSAYLFSVPAVEWLRRRQDADRRPATVFGVMLAASGIPLLAWWPDLLVVGGAVAVLAGVAVALNLAGHPKSVLVSLVEVGEAVALVPAAAIVAGSLAEPATWYAVVAVAIYLVGTVLLVRSMIRARGNPRFVAGSIGFHALGAVVAAAVLPWPYAVFAAALLARAIALPAIASQQRSRGWRLRPIHIGVIEIIASTALVLLAFGVGF